MYVHPDKSIVLILGMHRSGTSCLTGSLQDAGLFLGKVNTKAGFNAKGNRENVSIMSLQEQVLKRVGASWDQPPVEKPIWNEKEIDLLKNHISEYSDQDKWGFKDPRTLFMLHIWEKMAPLRFVGTYRHPVEVVNSLTHRANKWGVSMDKTHAFHLWYLYNTQLIQLYERLPFDILRYDVPKENYKQTVSKLAKNLNLPFVERINFREEALRNQNLDDSFNIPSDLKFTWEKLNEISL